MREEHPPPMSEQRISDLALLIPEETSYRKGFSPFGWMPAVVELIAEASTDPAFGAKFVDAFAEVRKPLPECIHEFALLRAYAYRRFGTLDPDVEAALELEHDLNAVRRTRLRCMLLRHELSYTIIAQQLGVSADSVRIYQALFWPVRDRSEVFTIALVYPESRQCELAPDYAKRETVEHLAYRAAFHHGMEGVDHLLGVDDSQCNKDMNKLAETLERQILGNGLFLADCGFLNQDLPGLKNAISVLRMTKSKPGRQQQQPVPVSYGNGVNAAVAVSQSLARATPAFDQGRWSNASTTDTGRESDAALRKRVRSGRASKPVAAVKATAERLEAA
jgi:hypothetical protein